jgi:molybdopterin converting factor subunit 1
MTVSILAFGIAKEIAGGAVVNADLPDTCTVAMLKSVLETKYPRLVQLSSLMIAVNGEYARHDTLVNAGDEIALIPPVSGG